jgi:NAD(P)-dependent dehydrogenase (short-subunit alcohol dehydrogenase family)
VTPSESTAESRKPGFAGWWGRLWQRQPEREPDPAPAADDMRGKTVLVTGSTDGIGRETALELGQRGAHVLVHARSLERGEPVVAALRAAAPEGTFDLVAADFASLAQVRALAAEVRARSSCLDVLINNAGIFAGAHLMSEDGYEITLAVNHLAPFLLTNLLLDHLRAAAQGRVVNMSSMVHYQARINFDDLQLARQWNAGIAYGQSKLANVLFAFKLARLVDGTPVTSNALHPGVIATKLLAEGFGVQGADVSEGAYGSVYLAAAPEVARVNGAFFGGGHREHPARICHDHAVQDRLWAASADLCGPA